MYCFHCRLHVYILVKRSNSQTEAIRRTASSAFGQRAVQVDGVRRDWRLVEPATGATFGRHTLLSVRARFLITGSAVVADLEGQHQSPC
jgi:hypothetical protein